MTCPSSIASGWLTFRTSNPSRWHRSSVSPRSARAATRTGDLPRPEEVEVIPWATRDLDWLASSLGYLRGGAYALAAVSGWRITSQRGRSLFSLAHVS